MLHPGDIIHEINGKSIKGFTADDVAETMVSVMFLTLCLLAPSQHSCLISDPPSPALAPTLPPLPLFLSSPCLPNLISLPLLPTARVERHHSIPDYSCC